MYRYHRRRSDRVTVSGMVGGIATIAFGAYLFYQVVNYAMTPEPVDPFREIYGVTNSDRTIEPVRPRFERITQNDDKKACFIDSLLE